MRFDLDEGFPLVTTKKLHVKSIVHELLWFLAARHQRALSERATGSPSGTSGPTRRATSAPSMASSGGRGRAPDGRTIDQIAAVVAGISAIPTRGASSSAPGTSASSTEMALSPCHCLFQFYVADGRLSCQLYQRSADVFLGVPFNIATYALLTLMMAQVTRPRARRVRPHLRRRPPVPQPPRAPISPPLPHGDQRLFLPMKI